jgi:hypothetical protein
MISIRPVRLSLVLPDGGGPTVAILHDVAEGPHLGRTFRK